ncbi:MAG: hypothetical protein H6918_05035 [Sphingomonadaceae bacterium]|nr:hypothetical protein [Sphingomonadaceae bacterium]
MFEISRRGTLWLSAAGVLALAAPHPAWADAGNLREPAPYITCTTGALLGDTQYVYVGRYSRALWAMDMLKPAGANVYTRQFASEVRMSEDVIAAGRKPILKLVYADSRGLPYDLWITGEPVRLRNPPHSVATRFKTKSGNWTVADFLLADSQVALNARYGPEKAAAMTRPFIADVIVDGSRTVYSATFQPDLKRQRVHVRNLFSIGHERFDTKPVNTPGCIDDATGKPPRILYPSFQRH